ncbi:hypothetical protein SDC9_187400 [bioreactor metagenome]|uniref:RCK C-terminal domain-containing protein n=1 Tax=bioreactor metagenome TaxID=1076179 RepID=A0A645HMS2_9ZZZZ
MHPWAGKALSAVLLPPDTILVLIQRGEEKIVPSGATDLRAGDILVLSAKAPCRFFGTQLYEKRIRAGDAWENKPILEILKKPGVLIVMIKRSDGIIIPKGDTVLRADDVLVINRS